MLIDPLLIGVALLLGAAGELGAFEKSVKVRRLP
jgi:hypothetical protein